VYTFVVIVGGGYFAIVVLRLFSRCRRVGRAWRIWIRFISTVTTAAIGHLTLWQLTTRCSRTPFACATQLLCV
jgi:hypothetical protein